MWQVVSMEEGEGEEEEKSETDSCQRKESAVINGLIRCITVLLVTNRHQQKQAKIWLKNAKSTINVIYSNFDRYRERGKKAREGETIDSGGPREQHTVYIHTYASYTYIQFTLRVLFLGLMITY